MVAIHYLLCLFISVTTALVVNKRGFPTISDNLDVIKEKVEKLNELTLTSRPFEREGVMGAIRILTTVDSLTFDYVDAIASVQEEMSPDNIDLHFAQDTINLLKSQTLKFLQNLKDKRGEFRKVKGISMAQFFVEQLEMTQDEYWRLLAFYSKDKE